MRYHGNPEMNHFQQTNADHTWGVLVLLDFFWPDADLKLFRAALHHDTGEETDASGPQKREHPALAQWLDESEAKSRAKLLGADPLAGLSPQEQDKVDFCDKVEAILYVATRNRWVLAGDGWPQDIERARQRAQTLGVAAKLHNLLGRFDL